MRKWYELGRVNQGKMEVLLVNKHTDSGKGLGGFIKWGKKQEQRHWVESKDRPEEKEDYK